MWEELKTCMTINETGDTSGQLKSYICNLFLKNILGRKKVHEKFFMWKMLVS